MSILTTGTIPGTIAGFTDFINISTPAVRFRRGTNIIRRMMFPAGCAVPVMFAVFDRHQDLIARCAHAITRNVGLRTGVSLLIAGTIPILVAVSIRSIGLLAGFAIPVFAANKIGHMPIETLCAPPPMGATALLRCIGATATLLAAPAIVCCRTKICFCVSAFATGALLVDVTIP